jgi:hypothetical protein
LSLGWNGPMGARQEHQERRMRSMSRTPGVRPVIGACLFAALSVVSVPAWDEDPTRDGPTDELLSPSCRIGSLQSWQGRPCVVPIGPTSAEETVGTQ